MLRISRGRETLTIIGDHLETNFKGFDQKSLHWRPRSPMETSVAISADLIANFKELVRILKGMETLTLNGDHLETNF